MFSTGVESSLPAPDAERMLKERRPNAVNGDELLRLMNETRSERRQWISEQQPSVTSILQRYPRFIDMNSSVSFVVPLSLLNGMLFNFDT